MVTTLAGSSKGNIDGEGINACFNGPFGICLNPLDECLYTTDRYNNSIRKITVQGKKERVNERSTKKKKKRKIKGENKKKRDNNKKDEGGT